MFKNFPKNSSAHIHDVRLRKNIYVFNIFPQKVEIRHSSEIYESKLARKLHILDFRFSAIMFPLKNLSNWYSKHILICNMCTNIVWHMNLPTAKIYFVDTTKKNQNLINIGKGLRLWYRYLLRSSVMVSTGGKASTSRRTCVK